MNNIIEDFKTVKEQVTYLLERYPMTRNNDLYLIVLWMKIFGGVSIGYVKYDLLKDLSGKPETIRRTRQIIQNKEQHFLPTDSKILVKRGHKQEVIKQNIHKV